MVGRTACALRFVRSQVLYYHGNNITNINDVLKLQALPKLTKLTLHGNPISENKNYKVQSDGVNRLLVHVCALHYTSEC